MRIKVISARIRAPISVKDFVLLCGIYYLSINSVEMKALLDSGSEVNIIRRDIALATRLTIILPPKLKVKPITGPIASF